MNGDKVASPHGLILNRQLGERSRSLRVFRAVEITVGVVFACRKSRNPLIDMFLGDWRKLECREEAHTDSQKLTQTVT